MLINEMIQYRRDQIDAESSKVIGGETISDERLKEMKDTFVRNSHTCQKVHKNSVMKDMSEGRLVNNSMDRKCRNAGKSRFGQGVNESNDMLITQVSAFESDNRWVRPSVEDNLNSGSDQIKSDDFCLVLLRGRTSSQKNPKPSSCAYIQHLVRWTKELN